MLERLFSPLALGPIEIRNRVVSTSHQTSLVHDHLPTDDLIAYHRARAAGGAGLIVVEATAVHPTGLLTAHTVGGYLPEIVPVWERMSAAVTEHGTRLICQLFHGGREMIASGTRPPAVAPSSIPSARFKTEPRALTRAEIAEMLEGYRQAAAYAAEGGLDGVEVCAGFGYLPTQFLSRHANVRTDEYGGSFENRFRFLREVLEAMRDGFGPNGAVGCRLTDERTSAVGTDFDDILAAAEAVGADGLADYVSVTLGSSTTYRGSTWIVPPSPAAVNAITEFAAAVKARTAVPVIATGRVLDPADADRLIGEGVCDAVGMTRAQIADPNLARRAQAGEPITRCIGCNQGCIGHYHAGVPIACTVNPWAGYERSLPLPAPAETPGTVVVVGAGPAGCAAAASAAARGHRVVVFERAERPGGQMQLALAAPGHAEVAEGLLEILARWISDVDVRYGAEASARDVLDERPDRVVVATGADPYVPALGGDRPGCRGRVGGTRGCSGGRPRGRERLGRRLDRPRHGRDARRPRRRGAARHLGGGVRRGHPPVPAKPLPGAARQRGSRAQPPPAAGVGRAGLGDLRERLLRKHGHDRGRGHARRHRRPDGRRRALPRARGLRRACRTGRRLPGPPVVRGGDPRGHPGRPPGSCQKFGV